MEPHNLKKIYKLVFNVDPDFSNRKDKEKMLSAAYLLQVMGVNLDDKYYFTLWNDYPRSNDLLDDMNRQNKGNAKMTLSKENREIISKLSQMMSRCPDEFDITEWAKLLATIHYKHDYIMSFNRAKTVLRSTKIDAFAYEIVSPYFVLND